MEAMIYEVRPWAFVAVGIYCVINSAHSNVLLFSGIILASAAGMIIFARSQNRTHTRSRK
jgi:hypothetical protein